MGWDVGRLGVLGFLTNGGLRALTVHGFVPLLDQLAFVVRVTNRAWPLVDCVEWAPNVMDGQESVGLMGPEFSRYCHGIFEVL